MHSKCRTSICFFFLFVLFSCSSEDPQFCECLKLTKKLNERSREALSKSVTKEQATEIKKLSSSRKEKCEDYFQMDGKKLRELQSNCE